MFAYLKQSTASQTKIVGPFIDDTDFKTTETGLTIANTDVKLSANGGSSANKNSGGGTHIANGMYALTFDATDTAAVGELNGSIVVSGALVVTFKFWILEEAVYDDFMGASAPGYLKPTTATRTLDVTAAGTAGIDWGNVENASTSVDLSSTSINLCDTITTYTGNTVQTGDNFARLGVPAGASVSADIAAVKVDTAAIFLDTDDMQPKLGTPAADISADIAAVKVDTAEIGTAGAGLTNINLPNQTMDITGNITGNLSGSVGSVTGAVGSVTAQVSANVTAISGDSTAADNLELQYDTTGLTGDNFPATQAQVSSLSTGAGGLSTTAGSDTLTTGTETGTVTNTTALDGAYHQITASGGNTEIYYEFDVGSSGVATEVIWDGRVNSNGDSMDVYGYDWVAAGWSQVGTIIGQNGSTDLQRTFIFTTGMTGSAANVGTVRCRFLSADATQLYTDRILCEFTSVAAESQIFASGVAQSGGNNSIQLASGDVTADDQFRRSKVLITGGTGANQEAIITASVASTDTLTTTPTWLTNPDSTSSYEVVPAQTHQTVRNGGYDNGRVYIDTVNGTAGTQKGVNGTSTNPSSSEADAYTIAGNENITTFFVEPGSAVTLPSNSQGFKFEGTGWTLDLNEQEIGNCTFDQAATVTGTGVDTLGENPANFMLCGIGTVTLPPCTGFQCGFFGTLTIGSEGDYTFGNSADVFNSALTLDYGSGNNASQFFLQSWGGGSVEIQNAGAGTGTYVFEMSGTGDLTINANCSDTTNIKLNGTIPYTNNSAITTIDNDGNGAQLITEVGTAGAGLTDLGGMSTAMKAEVNAEALDVLVTDTHAEVSGVIAATSSIKDKINWMFALCRNKITQTGSTQSLRNDADSGNIATSTTSDDTTTAIRQEFT